MAPLVRSLQTQNLSQNLRLRWAANRHKGDEDNRLIRSVAAIHLHHIKFGAARKARVEQNPDDRRTRPATSARPTRTAHCFSRSIPTTKRRRGNGCPRKASTVSLRIFHRRSSRGRASAAPAFFAARCGKGGRAFEFRFTSRTYQTTPASSRSAATPRSSGG